MASFIVKQMMGDQLSQVKNAAGGGDDDKKDEEGEGEGGVDPEVLEARREAEEKRRQKHEEQEREREGMRQGIRDKYGIKKKEDAVPIVEPECDGRLGRKRKTAEELAAEANGEDEEEGSGIPQNLDELKAKFGELQEKLPTSVGQVTEKCSIQ